MKNLKYSSIAEKITKKGVLLLKKHHYIDASNHFANALKLDYSYCLSYKYLAIISHRLKDDKSSLKLLLFAAILNC